VALYTYNDSARASSVEITLQYVHKNKKYYRSYAYAYPSNVARLRRRSQIIAPRHDRQLERVKLVLKTMETLTPTCMPKQAIEHTLS